MVKCQVMSQNYLELYKEMIHCDSINTNDEYYNLYCAAL